MRFLERRQVRHDQEKHSSNAGGAGRVARAKMVYGTSLISVK
jgi:hypothetical protein